MPLAFFEATLGAVFHASWQAAILAMLVLVVARVVPRLPAAAKSGLWLIVLARLLCPVTPPSSWSLFNLARFPADSRAIADPPADRAIGTERAASLPQGTPSEVSTAVPSRPLPFVHAEPWPAMTIPAAGAETVERTSLLVAKPSSIADILASIWVLGVAVVLASGVRSWLRLRQFLRSCRLCSDEGPLAILERCRREAGLRRKVTLWVSDAEVAPALASVVFPRIIISARALAAIGPAELEWLFRHELAHIRRWDLACVRLWWCARALHWFNPLVWWAASRAGAEAEMACDESVIRRASASEWPAYGQTLLTVAELLGDAPPVPAAAGISLGEPVLSRRIRAIAGYRPASRAARFAVVLVLIGVAGGGLTDAIERSARGATESGKTPATPISKAAAQSGSNQAAAPSTFGLPTDAQGRPQLAAVLDAWQKGRGRLKSYEVYVTNGAVGASAQAPRYELLTAEALGTTWTRVRRKFSRCVCSREKLRVEEGVAKPGEKPTDIVSVWDGELAKCEMPRVKQFSVEGSLSHFGAGYERLRAGCANGSDMIDVLRKRPGTLVERVDQHGIVVYTPAPQPFGYRVWLDPAKGFQPTRIHRLLERDGTLIIDFEQENTLDEVDSGVWVPVKIAMSFFAQDKSSATAARRPKFGAVVTVNRKYSRFNVPIDASLFQLPVPLGFAVADDVCHRYYEFGKANTSLTQISQWVLEGKMSAKDYKEFVKRSGVAEKPVHGEVKQD